ncbi:MAG: hypothetical protein ACI85O_001778 [Saprospiraceae bacterium]|jgi:hypothetical protein
MELLIGLAVAAVFFIKSRQEKSWFTPALNSEMLYLKRGGSRGMKVLEISIDTEGKAGVSVGKESAKMISLNKGQREELKVLSNAAFAGKLEATYLTGARDLPKTTLRYQGNSVVFHNRNAPEALVSLARKVREMTTPE